MVNNEIFKKIRIALQLTDDNIMEILKLAEFEISKSELNAIFRKEDHPNYQLCGDQLLRNFLNGLIIYKRGPQTNVKKMVKKEFQDKNKPTKTRRERQNNQENSSDSKKDFKSEKRFDKKNDNKNEIKPKVIKKQTQSSHIDEKFEKPRRRRIFTNFKTEE